MRRIFSFEQLENMTNNLFVEAVCPKCERILISLIPQAQNIIVFGCVYCTDIDDSMLLPINVILPSDIVIDSEIPTVEVA